METGNHARRVLITRPEADAESLTESLRQRGWQPVLAPLLSLVWSEGPPLGLAGTQALLFTSANGVRAFVRRNRERDLPVFAVGDATARMARASGFAAVTSAAGDVESLAATVAAHCRPEAGALRHGTGSVVAGDLAGRLGGQGFTVIRDVLYTAQTATALPPEAVAALNAGTLHGAVFFSPRTAHAFVSLARAAGVDAACGRLVAFCLSPAVAQAVAGPADHPCPWQAIRTAAHPDQAALLALFPDEKAGVANFGAGIDRGQRS